MHFALNAIYLSCSKTKSAGIAKKKGNPYLLQYHYHFLRSCPFSHAIKGHIADSWEVFSAPFERDI